MKKKSWADKFGERLKHAKVNVMKKDQEKAEKSMKKVSKVHVVAGHGSGAVVGTNARAKPQVVARK